MMTSRDSPVWDRIGSTRLLADFVPFPVAIAHRWIIEPTRAGERYRTQVRLREQTTEVLLYDLEITGVDGRLRERITGLRMRDVSAGRIRPPGWVKAARGKAF